jgi:hypothetical protein
MMAIAHMDLKTNLNDIQVFVDVLFEFPFTLFQFIRAGYDDTSRSNWGLRQVTLGAENRVSSRIESVE